MDWYGLIVQAAVGAGGLAREAIAKLVMMLRSWKSQEEIEGGQAGGSCPEARRQGLEGKG